MAIEPQTRTVAAQMRTSDFLEQLHETGKKIPLEAVSDFIRRNQHSNSIPADLASAARVRILTREQARRLRPCRVVALAASVDRQGGMLSCPSASRSRDSSASICSILGRLVWSGSGSRRTSRY